jgi:hypothetical protein
MPRFFSYSYLIALLWLATVSAAPPPDLGVESESFSGENVPLVRIPEEITPPPPTPPPVKQRFVRTSTDSTLKCSSTDDTLASEGLRWLESLRNGFDSALASTEAARGCVDLFIMSPDSKNQELQRSILFSQEKGFTFTLQAHPFMVVSRDSDLLFLITELFCYEYATRQTPSNAAELPPLPFWLVDGLAQQLNPPIHTNLRRIIVGCVRRKATPSFSQIAGWTEPAADPLHRVWQRAFTFWAVRQLIYSRTERQNLARWLQNLITPKEKTPAPPLWENITAAELWWKTLIERGAELPPGQRFDPDSTREELSAILVSQLNPADAAPPRAQLASESAIPEPVADTKKPFAFDQLLSAKQDAIFFLEMQKKEAALQQLLNRSDWLYAPLVARYLAATRMLLERPRMKEFPAALANIAELEKAIETQRESVRNLVDWWEINYGTPQHERWEVPPFDFGPAPTKNATAPSG